MFAVIVKNSLCSCLLEHVVLLLSMDRLYIYSSKNICDSENICVNMCRTELVPQLIHLMIHLILMHHLIYPFNEYGYENYGLERIVSIDIN